MTTPDITAAIFWPSAVVVAIGGAVSALMVGLLLWAVCKSLSARINAWIEETFGDEPGRFE